MTKKEQFGIGFRLTKKIFLMKVARAFITELSENDVTRDRSGVVMAIVSKQYTSTRGIRVKRKAEQRQSFNLTSQINLH